MSDRQSRAYEGQDYESFWQGPAKDYQDRLERALIAAELSGGQAVVDIGAGFGRLTPAYVDRFAEVHLVEPASNLRRIAAERLGARARYHDADVYGLPFADASIDAALMVRVFHHLTEPDVALREVHRILRPGGVFVFNYSNKRNLRRIARFLVGRGANPFTAETEAYSLPSLYGQHPRQVRALLDDAGFDVRRTYSVGVVDKLVGLVPPLGRLPPSVRLAALLGRLPIWPAEFIVAVKRKLDR